MRRSTGTIHATIGLLGLIAAGTAQADMISFQTNFTIDETFPVSPAVPSIPAVAPIPVIGFDPALGTLENNEVSIVTDFQYEIDTILSDTISTMESELAFNALVTYEIFFGGDTSLALFNISATCIRAANEATCAATNSGTFSDTAGGNLLSPYIGPNASESYELSVIRELGSATPSAGSFVRITGAGTADMTYTFEPATPISEPTTLMLLASGLVGLGVRGVRRAA